MERQRVDGTITKCEGKPSTTTGTLRTQTEVTDGHTIELTDGHKF